MDHLLSTLKEYPALSYFVGPCLGHEISDDISHPPEVLVTLAEERLKSGRDPLHPDPVSPPAPSEREPAVLGPRGAAERAAASASPRLLPLRQVKRRRPPPLRQVKRVGSPLSATPWLRPTPGRRPAPSPSLQPAPLGLGREPHPPSPGKLDFRGWRRLADWVGTTMGNAAGSAEQPASPAALSPKHPAAPKQPMPAAGELEERFNRVLNCMNLPPDKVQLLSQYDNEKKWELICDQERFQVKNPPEAYIQKLKSYLEIGGVSRKVAADWMSNLGVYVSPFSSVPFPLHFPSSGQLE
ncbi:hypothetical protein J1605_003823 [Eschrichtius robustus]|uniref:Formin GTPase-binding domain-containing protein n=1 Tax=Eschrichtius robustus TaxID=9764 RepID=A0AB34HQ08_ESCRO|nr:hypothetical protein J1605_003823 [Eschrichtius robustus]